MVEEGRGGKLTSPLTVSNKDISSRMDCGMKQLARESFLRGLKCGVLLIISICSIVCSGVLKHTEPKYKGNTLFFADFFFFPPLQIKLHILEWPFIATSPRHTCALIILFNQHPDMPHLSGGWVISAKEKCSQTQI